VNGQVALTAALVLAVAAMADDPAQAHLAAAYQLLLAGDGLDTVLAAWPPEHPARLAYGTVALASDKTRMSIVTGTAAGLQLWADPEVAWATAAQDHDLGAVGAGDRPTAIFVVVPHDDASRNLAAGLYLAALFRALTHEARRHGGRLSRRVWFLLDEFGNLPPIPEFDQLVTVSAGMGIRLVLAVQSLAQLKKHYADQERTIRGNLGTLCFLRTADLQTAEELSRIVGSYTTHTESLQYPKIGWWASVTPRSASQGQALTGRQLVTPDELLRWPADSVLLWQAGHAPARLPLPDLSQWQPAWPELQTPHWPAWPEQPVPPVRVPWGADAGDGDDGDHDANDKEAPNVMRPQDDNDTDDMVEIDAADPLARLFADAGAEALVAEEVTP
jgi:type IV secretion system protein VirD4